MKRKEWNRWSINIFKDCITLLKEKDILYDFGGSSSKIYLFYLSKNYDFLLNTSCNIKNSAVKYQKIHGFGIKKLN